MSAHIKQQKTDLEHVDIKCSHGPRVLVFLGNDDLGVSSYDSGWVIQNDIPILAPGDQDSGDSLACGHAVRPPDQLVVPARQTPTGYHQPPSAPRTLFYSAGKPLLHVANYLYKGEKNRWSYSEIPNPFSCRCSWKGKLSSAVLDAQPVALSH